LACFWLYTQAASKIGISAWAALGLDDLKWFHISNIEPFKIVKSQELLLKPKSDF
jgi:hypothetical protein